MSISKLSWTGVAREATAGTAIATPTMFIPVKSKFQNKTKYVYLNEDRGTRDGNNVRVGTVRMATGDLSGAVYLDTFPYLLLGFMGGITSTQPNVGTAPTAYQHALALADVPPALTLFKGYDFDGYYWAYSTVNKMKFSFEADGKVLEHSTNVEGQYGVKIGGTFSSMVPTYGSIVPYGGYLPTITLDGTTQSTIIERMEIELDQKITLFYSARGNRAFLKADYDERTAKVSFDARFDDDSIYNLFLTTEADSHVTLGFQGINLGGAVFEEFNMDFPIVGWDEMELDTSKSSVLVKAKGIARPGNTKNSLFTATVINTTAAYTV